MHQPPEKRTIPIGKVLLESATETSPAEIAAGAPVSSNARNVAHDNQDIFRAASTSERERQTCLSSLLASDGQVYIGLNSLSTLRTHAQVLTRATIPVPCRRGPSERPPTARRLRSRLSSAQKRAGPCQASPEHWGLAWPSLGRIGRDQGRSRIDPRVPSS